MKQYPWSFFFQLKILLQYAFKFYLLVIYLYSDLTSCIADFTVYLYRVGINCIPDFVVYLYNILVSCIPDFIGPDTCMWDCESNLVYINILW